VPSATSPRKLPRVTASTWVKLATKSFAAAAVVAAAQLGVGQALGILEWEAAGDDAGRRRLLTWLVFIFAAAVLGGAAAGGRSIRGIRAVIINQRALAAAIRRSGVLVVPHKTVAGAPRRAVRAARNAVRSAVVDLVRGTAVTAARVSATIAAVLGAAVAFPLVWVPARVVASSPGTTPVRTIAVTAGAGILIGLILAFAALSAAPIAAGAGTTVTWVWMAALTSVGLALAADRVPDTPRLGMIDAPLTGSVGWWVGPYLMVGVAAVLGVVVAATARWVGANRLGISLSGFAGPALVAAAYLIAGPGTSGAGGAEGADGGGLVAPYIASLLAATVGLLASTATAAAHRGEVVPARRAAAPASARASQPVAAIASLRPPRPAALPRSAPVLAIEAAPVVAPPASPPARAIQPAAVTPVASKPTPAARPTPAAKPTSKVKPTPKAKPSKAKPIPAAVAAPAPAPRPVVDSTAIQTGSAEPLPRRRKGRPERPTRGRKNRLHKREKEHIDWVQNLVNIPPDPELLRRK